MKKIMQSLMVAALALSMFGCGKEDSSVSAEPKNSKDKTEEVAKDSASKTEKSDTDKVENKTNDEDEPLTPKQQEAQKVSSGRAADKSKFPAGEYYVATAGMHVRKRTTVNSTEVYSGFPVGTVLQISSAKTGVDDPMTVWGKINSPVSGWICIADTKNGYLLTEEEWKELHPTTSESAIGVGEIVDDSDVDAESLPEENVGKKTATVEVVIDWQGEAAEHMNEVDELILTLDDGEPCTVKLNADNNWSAKFKLNKGAEFTCFIDFSDYYQIIKEFDYKWNVSTGVFTYTVW